MSNDDDVNKILYVPFSVTFFARQDIKRDNDFEALPLRANWLASSVSVSENICPKSTANIEISVRSTTTTAAGSHRHLTPQSAEIYQDAYLRRHLLRHEDLPWKGT